MNTDNTTDENRLINSIAAHRSGKNCNGAQLSGRKIGRCVLALVIAATIAAAALVSTSLCNAAQAESKLFGASNAQDLAGETGIEPARPLTMIGAVSRKTHGSAGEFDIELPSEPPFGVECRGTSGDHTIVITFSNELESGNASITDGKGLVTSAKFSANNLIVTLAEVADEQLLTLSISQVVDSLGQSFPDFTITMQTLLGDANGSGTVNAADISLAKSELGQPVTDSNFSADVNASGEINSSDVALIKAHSGSGVPIADTPNQLLVSALSDDHAQSLSFTGPATIDLTSTTELTVLVDLTFSGYSSYGLSYWLEVSNAIASYLTVTNVTHTIFLDPNQNVPNPATFNSTSGASAGYAAAPRDLGATAQTVDPQSAIPPGTHQISALTFSVNPAAPSGTYTLRSTTTYPYVSEVVDTDFDDNLINPSGTFSFTITGGTNPTPTPTPTPATYAISVSASPLGSGTVSGGGNYTSGASVTVTATANSGHNFVNWTENGNVASTSATYTFTANSNRALVANFVSALPTAATPTISPSGGTFRKKVKVTLRDATPGAKIYYTINGADPTVFSALYRKPFKINGRGTYAVKAKAIKTGYNDSAVATATFTIR